MSFCQIKVTTAQTIAIDTETLISFDNEITDPDSEFDTGTNTFTAGTAGDHLIFCHVYLLIGDGWWSENQYDKLIIKINDSDDSFHQRWHTTIAQDQDTHIVGIATLAVDDTVKMYIKHNATNTKDVGQNSTLSIKRL